LVTEGPSPRLLELMQVGQVDGSRRVAAVEPHLLPPRQARHCYAIEHTFVEGTRRVVEVTAVQVRLAPVAARVEDDRVQVDPPEARCGELDPDRTPVGFHPVAALLKHPYGRRVVLGVHRKVQIPMRAGLTVSSENVRSTYMSST